MNKRFLAVLTAGICLLASGNAYSQDYSAPEVTVSTEKVKMEGKQYYSHIVLEKQTIYSIGKAYGVTADEIYSANPGLKETGLKKNAVILIPDKMSDKESGKPAQTARKKKKAKEDGNYIIHTVKWYEDLDVISEKYGVPVDVIMEINGLKGRKLRNRQKLRIPSEPMDYSDQAESGTENTDTGETAEQPAVTQDKSHDTTDAQDRQTNILLLPAKAVNISILLPLDAKDSTSGSWSNMDFYSGALLAARDMGEEGVGVELSVFDVSSGQLHVTEERLRSSDVVIGPVSYGDLSRLMSVTPDDTYVVSPLDHRAEKLVTSYRNFIQAPTSYATQYDDLVDWIKEEKTPEDSVLVIYEKGGRSSNIEALTKALESSGMHYQTFSYSILEGRDILNSLKDKMSAFAKTHMLIASESEAFVNDVVRNINLLVYDKFDISLYASSKIRSFETIEVENLHNANLHVTTSYYIDYDRKDVQKFIMEYRALFNTEPTPFAFQGYDITRYFAEISSKYGKAWSGILSMDDEDMLQSGFKFARIHVGASEVGYVNTAVRRLVYGPDYTVSLVKGL